MARRKSHKGLENLGWGNVLWPKNPKEAVTRSIEVLRKAEMANARNEATGSKTSRQKI